jgi:hypothetical protein
LTTNHHWFDISVFKSSLANYKKEKERKREREKERKREREKERKREREKERKREREKERKREREKEKEKGKLRQVMRLKRFALSKIREQERDIFAF